MTSWRIAFREQARPDFAAARRLRTHPEQHSQATMLLQMAWEKLAKAGLAAPSNSTSPTRSRRRSTHDVANKFLEVFEKMCNDTPLPVDVADRAAWFSDLKLLLPQLQALTPAIAGKGANTEYPWQDCDNAILWPAEHLTRLFTSPDGRGQALWDAFEIAIHTID